jgi:hypothetical protein
MKKIPCARYGKVWEEGTIRTEGRLCDECKCESKCNHKWVAMEDGSNDLFCVKCSKKAKQEINTNPGPILVPLTHSITVTLSKPIKRETVNDYLSFIFAGESYLMLHKLDEM